MVDLYVIKNWALSLKRESSNAWQFRHVVKNHWGLSDEMLQERSQAKNSDASTFRDVSMEYVKEGLITELLSEEENLLRIMRWVNSKSDTEDMAFIKNAGCDVGTCHRRDGSIEVCQKVVFWFRKDDTSMMPHLASMYPVPRDYKVSKDRLSNRYKTPKASA